VGDDLEVRFAHPLIGSVVYARMGTLPRRALHERLAAHATDPDLRAHHLALCTEGPDAAVADVLEQAARRASERGALGVAAEFAEHAVRLTPPADGGARRRRALDHIGRLTAAGEAARALALANRLIAELPPGPARAEALVQRAQLEDEDLETGEALLVRALDDAGDDAPLRGRLLDQLGWLRGIFRGDLAAGIACAREALDLADAVGDREFQMSAAAGLSNMETLAGTPRPELMERAVAIEDEIGRPPLWSGPRVLRGEQLLWAGDLAGARALFEAAVDDAARRNHERWLPYSLYDLSAAESAAGNLVRADELLRQALELARDCEDAHVESWIFYRYALVKTWLGRADEARAAAQRRLDAGMRRGERPGIARARSVLGLLALSEGDLATAAFELSESVRLLDAMGFAHPGAIPALPDAIEALALAGDGDAARERLDQLAGQAAAVGSAWALAALDRARGVVAFADGDSEGAVAALRAAATAFARLGFAPDAARARLVEGRALLRAAQRTAAGEALAGARDAFAAMGALLWEARAAEELDRAAPGRADGGLTAAESRIAALVAQGRKNREISQALFMSVATVEAHLTRIYRKLDIRSRSELTRLVAEGSLTLPVGGPSKTPVQHV
jgi:DNA-binding CsgD family transcriptional regulator/tetratricopeptide (TPR) repeat protein